MLATTTFGLPWFTASSPARMVAIRMGFCVVAWAHVAFWGPICLIGPPCIAAERVDAWLLPRADAGVTGRVSQALPENLVVRWETETDEAIESTPAVDSQRVYVADVMGGVAALDVRTGEIVWRQNVDTGFVAAPAILSDGLLTMGDDALPILFADNDESPARRDEVVKALTTDWKPQLIIGDVEGNVWSFNPADGSTLWKQTVDGQIDSAAAFFVLVDMDGKASSRVLVTSRDGQLRCLDASDGKQLWAYATNDQIQCGASIGDGKTLLGGCDAGLHIVDLRTGKASGKTLSLAGPTASTPAVADGQVFVPVMDGLVYRFDLDKTEPVWTFDDADVVQDFRGEAAVAEDRIIVASRNKQVIALSRQTGEVLWKQTVRRRPDASPLIAGDDVWIASSDGRLSRLSLATGDEKWNYEIRGAFIAAPAILNDRLIIADDDGVVRCFTAPQ